MPVFGEDDDDNGNGQQQERRLIPYVAPQRVVFGSIIDSNQNYLNFVPVNSVRIEMINLLDMKRRFLAMVPVKRIVLGQQIGSGGTNTVHRIDYEDGSRLDGMLIKDAGASSGRSREFEALKAMEAIGLRSVARGLTQMGQKTMLVMDYIDGCIDSKSIIGYMRTLKDYIDPEKDSPAPDRKFCSFIKASTIRDLLYGWERMVLMNKNFSDFQFLIDKHGNVIYNDPTCVSDDLPGETTSMIIQAMIDTWEFMNCPTLSGMNWQEFKRYKFIARQKMTPIFATAYRKKCSPPKFYLCDLSVFEGRNVAEYPSIFFKGTTAKPLPGWAQFPLANHLFGYFMPMNDVHLTLLTPTFQTALGEIQRLQALIKSGTHSV